MLGVADSGSRIQNFGSFGLFFFFWGGGGHLCSFDVGFECGEGLMRRP